MRTFANTGLTVHQRAGFPVVRILERADPLRVLIDAIHPGVTNVRVHVEGDRFDFDAAFAVERPRYEAGFTIEGDLAAVDRYAKGGS